MNFPERVGAQDEASIHWTKAADRNALGQVDQLYFLLVENLLHGVGLVGGERDARIFQVEIETIDFQRLGAHKSPSGKLNRTDYLTFVLELVEHSGAGFRGSLRSKNIPARAEHEERLRSSPGRG
jgi:hypothetical protein